MADLEKTVKIIFEGEDKALTKSIAGVAGQFDQISAIAGRVAEPLAAAADSILKMDAALAALTIGGLALAIKESSSFNAGFALISTSIDATGDDLKKYRDDVLNYSTTSVKSIEDINASLYTAAQAGIKYGDSLEFMRKSEELAVANKANLNTTVDLLTGTMNAYGYSIKDVGHLNDVFFTSTLIGKQTIDQLGQSMGQVVGIAANFGVSFEQLSAAISTLTAKGMETSEAITAVKGVITTIVSPSKEAAAAAEALGLNFSASSLKAEGLQGMLTKVMTATGGSADTMAKLFNEVRALNGVMQITGDGMEFFNKAMTQIANSAGSSEAAYKKMVDTFSNQSQMLINVAKGVLIDVGTRLEPIAAGITGSFGQLLSGIKIGVDAGAFDPLFKLLEEAGKELSTWLAGVAKALPDALKGLDFTKLIDSLKDLGGAFAEYFGNLDLTNVEDLHELIQNIIDGIAGLIRVTEGMVEGFRPFFVAINDFLLSIADSDVELQKMIGTVLAIAKAVQTFGLGLTAAALTIDQYGLKITGLFNVVSGGAQIMWNGLSIIANAIQFLFVGLEKSFLDLMNVLSLGTLDKFSPTFAKMREVVDSSMASVANSFVTNGLDAGRGLDKMIDGLSNLGSQAKQTGQDVEETGKSLAAIPEEKKTLWQFKGAEEIKNAIIDIGKEFVTVGEKAEKALPAEKSIVVGYIEDENGRQEIRQKIDAAVPKEKKIDVSMDTEKIKSQASVIETAIQWKAKLDIAEVEAGVKNLKTMFDSVDTGIKSTGSLMESLFGELNKAGTWNQDIIKEQIKLENERRTQEFEMQQKLIEQQLELKAAQTQAISGGKMAIEITASGLQPHLEMILWTILESIQIRATETAAEFLLGVGA